MKEFFISLIRLKKNRNMVGAISSECAIKGTRVDFIARKTNYFLDF